MKTFISSKGLLIVGILLTVFTLSDSCSKSSNNTNGSGGNGGNGEPGANEVWIQNMAYTPATISVSAGTTITWTNKDGVAHTVTSDTGLFDSGNISTNGTYSHTFDTAGTYTYHCTIHIFMKGTVSVQ
jgi:plastocyanin